MRRRALHIALATLALATGGCGGNDPAAPTVNTREMVAKRWKLQQVLQNGQDITVNSAEYTSFNADGTYTSTFRDGDTKRGTWELSADGKKLFNDKGTPREIAMDIIELSATAMRLKMAVPSSVEIVAVIP